jgi:hypothetical protein
LGLSQTQLPCPEVLDFDREGNWGKLKVRGFGSFDPKIDLGEAGLMPAKN